MPNPNKKVIYYTWRFRLVLLILLVVFICLVGRMLDLMVLNRAFLQKESDARVLRTVEAPAYRGMILDRQGNPLAISTPVKAVWINPQGFDPSQTQMNQLAKLLSTTPKNIRQQADKTDREFVYLQRGVQPNVADKIKALNIPGLFLRQEYRRYYPQAEVTAHILGMTNVDDKGQEGMELAYNATLQGQSSLRRVIKDRLGRVVEDIGVLRNPKPGQDITLSIDQRIQYSAYKNLKAAVEQFNATAGSIVVLDVKTGEVLAMANLPSYNPNQRSGKHDDSYRNRAVTDIFEPGSTAKPFTVYLGLESGKFTPTTLIKTAPGYETVSKHRVQDTANHGTITVAQVLQYSSNIGVSRIVLTLPPNQLWELLDKVGFGRSTFSGFPGESSAELTPRRYWDPFVLSTLSFGYGMSSTALQLARAYATIASKGLARPISLLKVNGDVPGTQIMNPHNTAALIEMMKTVAEDGGTAVQARVPGYWVAGKTGTSRMVGPHGYMNNHHNAVFAGFAPASDPRLVIVVYVNDPKKISYYAGTVAAPVFMKVMAEALQILNVPTDKPL
jgi:cell division protein FtsI (penicillin-binding protein 3)